MYCRRACNSCRQRKVKCNGRIPCLSCSTSQLSCIYSQSVNRRGPKVSKQVPRSELCQPSQDGQQKRHITVSKSPSILGVTPQLEQKEDEQGDACSDDNEETTLSCRYPLSRLQLCESSAVPENPTRSPLPVLAADLCLGNRFSDIYAWLLSNVEAISPSGDSATSATVLDVTHRCIDLFFQFMFPSTPVAHEGSLRSAASVFLPENHASLPKNDFHTGSHAAIPYAKSFTLITALCAFVASVMPESLLPNQHALVGPFSRSSRAMLKSYEDYDLEYPDSTSLTIRIWQSGALQNSTGRREAAWHIHSEASLLALRLRLYDEAAIRHGSSTESRLLRMNFWLLYSADKAAAALESRLAILDEQIFESHLNLLADGDNKEPFLQETRARAKGDLEWRLTEGFHLKTQIWAAGARVITGIKSLVRHQKRPGLIAQDRDAAIVHLSQTNIDFSILVHKLPIWLQRPEDIQTDDVAAAAYQKTCFWVQRSNILTAYHCLRLIILQKCVENDMLEVLGLRRQPLSLAMRRMEIVQDFVNELQNVPFLCYKVQGEAGVERIRHVASILLEFFQRVENDTLKHHVKFQLDYLLDYLARLDSKASDGVSAIEQ